MAFPANRASFFISLKNTIGLSSESRVAGCVRLT